MDLNSSNLSSCDDDGVLRNGDDGKDGCDIASPSGK